MYVSSAMVTLDDEKRTRLAVLQYWSISVVLFAFAFVFAHGKLFLSKADDALQERGMRTLSECSTICRVAKLK